MTQLVRLRANDTVQTAHCAMVMAGTEEAEGGGSNGSKGREGTEAQVMIMIMIVIIIIIMTIKKNNDDDSEELRRGREEAVRRIEGYHRHIDNCTAEMSQFFFSFLFK